jgi:hypothetical protein
MQVYIVNFTMASANRQLKTEDHRDKNSKEIYFSYTEEQRKKIQNIRHKYRVPALANYTFDFPGDRFGQSIRLCKHEYVPLIEAMAREANTELQEIDRSLIAFVEFLPLDLEAAKKGTVYGSILNAIRERVLDSILKKISEVVDRGNEELKPATKEMLLKLVDKMRQINVLEDEEIDRRLTEIRDQIDREVLAPLKVNLEQELETVQQAIDASHTRFGNIEL